MATSDEPQVTYNLSPESQWVGGENWQVFPTQRNFVNLALFGYDISITKNGDGHWLSFYANNSYKTNKLDDLINALMWAREQLKE